MSELEVKILEVNPDEMERRLQLLGATREFDQEFEAIFWDFPDGRLVQSRKVLRLRREGDRSVITFKTPQKAEGIKAMEELETGIGEAAPFIQILEALGLQPTRRTLKRRIQYSLENAHVVLDFYMEDLSAIPPFLEIEAQEAETVFEIVEKLGFRREQASTWNTYDLINHYLGPGHQSGL
jgi:adenylate cyclase class 2